MESAVKTAGAYHFTCLKCKLSVTDVRAVDIAEAKRKYYQLHGDYIEAHGEKAHEGDSHYLVRLPDGSTTECWEG